MTCVWPHMPREKEKERQKPDDLGNVRTCIQYHGRTNDEEKKGGELPSGTRTGFAEEMIRCDALRASEMND